MSLFGKKEHTPEKTQVSEKKKIRRFHAALKTIRAMVLTKDFENARKALQELLNKEKNGFSELSKKLGDGIKASQERQKQKNALDKKLKQIEKLDAELESDEKKYVQKIEKERFKVRFSKIKEELDILVKTKKAEQAMVLLSDFLEENKDKYIVVKLYNKEKKNIQKHIKKQEKEKEKKAKKDAKSEAMRLIGKTIDQEPTHTKNEKEKTSQGFLGWKKTMKYYKNIREGVRKRKLVDEIRILMEEDKKINQELAQKKLQNVHSGLIKEISKKDILGYDIYGKILGADKISGDTFGFEPGDKKYTFFLGDATGHGIRAGVIVSLLSRTFQKFVNKVPLQKLTFEINNTLKQDLKSKNFITGIFFEVMLENLSTVRYVGMGHEPMFIYRHKKKTVEKLIPGGLAAGIRIIKDEDNIKVKYFDMDDGDLLVTYSDGIVETKNKDGEYFGIERVQTLLQEAGKKFEKIEDIYNHIVNDLKKFKGGSKFLDDASMLILKRNKEKDVLTANSKEIDQIAEKEHLKRSEAKKLAGKTREQAKEEIEKIRKKKQLANIIKTLENLYNTGEMLKLKQEAERFIKEGFIDKRINDLYRKAIANKDKYKIKQKENRIRNKYNVLQELMKKGDYDTVIAEATEIIAKDGNT